MAGLVVVVPLLWWASSEDRTCVVDYPNAGGGRVDYSMRGRSTGVEWNTDGCDRWSTAWETSGEGVPELISLERFTIAVRAWVEGEGVRLSRADALASLEAHGSEIPVAARRAGFAPRATCGNLCETPIAARHAGTPSSFCDGRLGHWLLDDYLAMVASRARPNTVLAAAFDLKVQVAPKS